MREIPVLELGQAKGFWKRRERHLKERQRVNETNSVKVQRHDFATIADLLHDPVLFVIFVYHKVPVISLEIVNNNGHIAGVASCQGNLPF